MKRILVRAPNWIGDQIMAYPFYRQLRNAYPDAWIGVVCTEWVRDIQFRGLIDEVFVLPRSRSDSVWKTLVNVVRFSRKLRRKGPWDLGVSLPNSFGAALLMFLSGVRRRRGYVADARGILLNEGVRFDAANGIHRAQAYLKLLEREGAPGYEGQDFWTRSSESEFDPYVHWQEIEPIEPPEGAYFIIAPGSNADSRRWSAQNFADFIELMIAKHQMRAVVVGGKAEKEIAAALFKRGITILDYTGQGWVAAHWKLFRNAAFSVCNDSGLAHVAALCGSRVQVVWGAGDPKRTRPIGPGRVQIKVNPVDCWPCERNSCLFQGPRRNQCLKGIEAATILGEVENGFIFS
jgi:heptosyltransferase-2